MDKYPLIALAGKKRSGKNTLGDYLYSAYGYKQFAFADALREILAATDPWIWDENVKGLVGEPIRYNDLLKIYGYETSKDNFPELRRIMQYLGTEGVRKVIGEDTWVNTCLKRVREHQGPAVITDCRFLSEADAIELHGGLLVMIDRSSDEKDDGHASELEIYQMEHDIWIANNRTKDDLKGYCSQLHQFALERIASLT